MLCMFVHIVHFINTCKRVECVEEVDKHKQLSCTIVNEILQVFYLECLHLNKNTINEEEKIQD